MSFSSPGPHLPLPKLFRTSMAANGCEGTILSVGHDLNLLQSRAGILRMTRCEVVSAVPAQAGALLREKQYQLAVFGHTICDGEIAELALLIKQRTPETKLLLVCFDPRPAAIQRLFDAVVDSCTGPISLLSAAAGLLWGERYLPIRRPAP